VIAAVGAVTTAAALLTVAAAILAGAVVLARTRSTGRALPVLLDLLTAAGLLRLSAVPTWDALAVTAAVVALRRLVTAGVRTASTARRPTT
jgi:hypothetical protein